MKDMKSKCYLIVDLSKVTPNKKILSKIIVTGYNQVCSQTLSLLDIASK